MDIRVRFLTSDEDKWIAVHHADAKTPQNNFTPGLVSVILDKIW